jgi:hypothetical protein
VRLVAIPAAPLRLTYLYKCNVALSFSLSQLPPSHTTTRSGAGRAAKYQLPVAPSDTLQHRYSEEARVGLIAIKRTLHEISTPLLLANL